MAALLLFIIFVLSSNAAYSIPAETCSKPKDSGKCRDFKIKWYYDVEHGGCSRFWYGGCDGNANRFESQEECKSTCVEPVGQGACALPKTVGPCAGNFPSWYYDYNQKKCDQFVYGGCLGNNNRFATLDECKKLCSSEDGQGDVSRPSHDPCILSQCGPNSVCKVENDQGVCSCLSQYVGSPPDCRRPECYNSENCPIDHLCENWKCIKIQAIAETSPIPLDPCAAQPSICGPYSTCQNLGGYPSCSCLSNHVGRPPNCKQLECLNNTDCSSDKACIYSKCRDPCLNFCGEFVRCRVHNHNPICTCQEGYVIDETHRCRPKATSIPNVNPKCTDNQFYANCTLIVQAHYCTRVEQYTKYCCRSCTLAGQLKS